MGEASDHDGLLHGRMSKSHSPKCSSFMMFHVLFLISTRAFCFWMFLGCLCAVVRIPHVETALHSGTRHSSWTESLLGHEAYGQKRSEAS